MVDDDKHNWIVSVSQFSFLDHFWPHFLMICLSPGTSENRARQIYRIDFQPGLTRNQHPDHPPNQNVVPSERSPVRWLKALLQQQSPNCVASVQLEPKVAILNCCDFRLHHWNTWKSYGNHAMILGTELNLTSPLRFRVAPSCSSKTCIDVIKSFPSLRPSLSEQLESTSAMLNLGVSHGIAWYHPSNLKSSLNFSSQSRCHWHKKEEKHPITCQPQLHDQGFEWWYLRTCPIHTVHCMAGMDVAWTLKKGMDLDLDKKKPESLAIATQATESCTIVVSHLFPVSCNKYQVTICDNRW